MFSLSENDRFCPDDSEIVVEVPEVTNIEEWGKPINEAKPKERTKSVREMKVRDKVAVKSVGEEDSEKGEQQAKYVDTGNDMSSFANNNTETLDINYNNNIKLEESVDKQINKSCPGEVEEFETNLNIPEKSNVDVTERNVAKNPKVENDIVSEGHTVEKEVVSEHITRVHSIDTVDKEILPISTNELEEFDQDKVRCFEQVDYSCKANLDLENRLDANLVDTKIEKHSEETHDQLTASNQPLDTHEDIFDPTEVFMSPQKKPCNLRQRDVKKTETVLPTTKDIDPVSMNMALGLSGVPAAQTMHPPQTQPMMASLDPVLYQGVLSQLLMAYPDLATNMEMLTTLAVQQTTLLQMYMQQEQCGGLDKLAVGGGGQQGSVNQMTIRPLNQVERLNQNQVVRLNQNQFGSLNQAGSLNQNLVESVNQNQVGSLNQNQAGSLNQNQVGSLNQTKAVITNQPCIEKGFPAQSNITGPEKKPNPGFKTDVKPKTYLSVAENGGQLKTSTDPLLRSNSDSNEHSEQKTPVRPSVEYRQNRAESKPKSDTTKEKSETFKDKAGTCNKPPSNRPPGLRSPISGLDTDFGPIGSVKIEPSKIKIKDKLDETEDIAKDSKGTTSIELWDKGCEEKVPDSALPEHSSDNATVKRMMGSETTGKVWSQVGRHGKTVAKEIAKKTDDTFDNGIGDDNHVKSVADYFKLNRKDLSDVQQKYTIDDAEKSIPRSKSGNSDKQVSCW